MSRGERGFAFVLHAHLPFVLNHGRWPHGADWLNEAAAETYVPLLKMMREMERDGVPFRLNIDISPVLGEQLGSGAFREEFLLYLENKDAAARDNEADFQRAGNDKLASLARGWADYYRDVRREFLEAWNGDLLAGFRHFEGKGSVEIMTCAATHGYLPLLGRDTAVQAQIKTAVASHLRNFGSQPRGIWLPECAYRPRYAWAPPVGPRRIAAERKGVDEFLSENGIRYFITDAHMLRGGRAIGIYLSRFAALRNLWSRYERESGRPIETERSPHIPCLVMSSPSDHAPVAFFTRDPDTGMVVWSGEWGYPGDGNYLDFHKKHFPGGLRYWRVTQAKLDLGLKEVYEPEKVDARLDENAGHFVSLVRRLLADGDGDRILTAPFDAELFGHWWFEGVRWLELVLRKLASDPEVKPCRLGDWLEKHPPSEVVSLPEGSWGQGGFHWIWLNDSTAWTWERIYPAEERMEKLAGVLAGMEKHGDARAPGLRETLKLAARELLLLEASDWQFLISTVNAADYSSLRLVRHADAFDLVAGIADRIAAGGEVTGDERRTMTELSDRDFLFPEVDPAWWAKVEYP